MQSFFQPDANAVSWQQLSRHFPTILMLALVTGFWSVQAWDQSSTTNMAILMWVVGLVLAGLLLVKPALQPQLKLSQTERVLLWIGAGYFSWSIIALWLSDYGFNAKKIEPDLRFILFGLTLLAVRWGKLGIGHITLALCVASTSYGIEAWQESAGKHSDYRVNGDENAVTYGNGAFFIFALCAYMSTVQTKLWRGAMVLICASGALYAAILSGTRGSFITILPLLLWVAWHGKGYKRWALVAVIAGGLISLQWVPQLASKFERAIIISQSYLTDRPMINTSTGLRFEQWRAASCMAAQHPLAGVGTRSFKEAQLDDQLSCPITGMKDGRYFNQAHSVYFNTLATKGWVGLSLLAMFALWLGKSANTMGSKYRHGIWVGIICVLSFGLTVDLFFKVLVADRYLMTLAILIGIGRPPQ